MKKVLALVLLVAIAGGGFVAYRQVSTLTALPAAAAEAENALALEGLLLMGTLNVAALADLEVGLHGAPEGETLPAAYDPDQEDAWGARLEQAGVSLADVSYAVTAVYARDGDFGFGVGLFGDLRLDAIERALREFFRVLTPKGRAFVSLVNPPLEVMSRAGRHLSKLAGQPARWPTRGRMRRQVEAAGFRVESQRHVFRVPAGLILPSVLTEATRPG